jgi:hypothetical protein
MNGKTLFNILSNDIFAKRIFDGFWFPDLPPAEVTKNPALIIANTDESSGPGEHWCAIFIDNSRGICEYFDPLGQPPENKIDGYSFLPHLNKFAPIVNFNSIPVQSLTAATCGHHCIYFACWKARNYSFDFIITGIYSSNTTANDATVLKFVRNSSVQNVSTYF